MAYEWENDVGRLTDGQIDDPNEPVNWESLLEGVPTGEFSVDEILEEFGGGKTVPTHPEPSPISHPRQKLDSEQERPSSELSEENHQIDVEGKKEINQVLMQVSPEPAKSPQTKEDVSPKQSDMESKVIELNLPVREKEPDFAQESEKGGKSRDIRRKAKKSSSKGKTAFEDRKPKPLQKQLEKNRAEHGEDVQEEDSDLRKLRTLFRQLADQAENYAINMYEEEREEEEARKPHEAFVKRGDSFADDTVQERRDAQRESDWNEMYDEDMDEDEDSLRQKLKWKWPWLARLLNKKQESEEDLGPERLPSEMADVYKKRIGRLRLRAVLVFIIGIILGYAVFAQQYNLPFPGGGENRFSAYLSVSVALACMAAVLGLDVIRDGFLGLFHMKADATLLAAVSILASIADGFTLLFWQNRTETMPFCVISVLSLFFAMWGTDLNRRTRRIIYRTASVEHPYLVTKDSDKWDEGNCFTKHPGPIKGFVNQVEAPDGTQRIYRRMAPLLLLACLLFALLASFGGPEKGSFLWCFSALTAASASFSACLAYASPWSKLTRKLVKVGAVLAGWRGVSAMAGKSGIILTDTDLFPPGSIVISGMNTFGRFSADNVVAYTASVIREAGCGLDKVFHTLLRSQGTIYRRVEELEQYEQGGFSAIVRGEQVLVGSAAFLQAADVYLAPGLSVRNAVFCAIEGELAGIFALKYTLNPGVNGALNALFHSKLSPVLATRDFNLTPSMLSGRFKLNFKEVEFPNVKRRVQLSDPHQPYDLPITALLFREGLTPFVDAVVGGRRLHRATLIGNFCSVIGSIIGVLMAFYLTYIQAFQSISALNLLIFMLMWLVPGILAYRGVNRY